MTNTLPVTSPAPGSENRRPAVSDLDQQIRTAINDMTGSNPEGDVLFDIIRAILAYARGLDTRMPMIADGIRRTIAMELGLNAPETTPERASTGLTGVGEGSTTGPTGIEALKATGISVEELAALHDHYAAPPGIRLAEAIGEWSEEPCHACGRPRHPDHDADAPGPTVKHPFTLVRGRIEPDGEIHGSAERRLTIGDQP